MREEVAVVQERQRRLEDAAPLSEPPSRDDEVRQMLHSPQISESEYLQLRTQDSDTLPLRDYIRVWLWAWECVQGLVDSIIVCHSPLTT